MRHLCKITMFAATVAAVACAEPVLQLGAPFADHAVLQRGMKVPVWGWSAPGDTITVAFAGQAKTATAGDDGKWMVEIEPLEASFEPATMAITGRGGASVTVTNILVGEVWLASGQSNMQWPVWKTTSGDLVVEPREDGVAPIREFTVRSSTAQLHPIEKATGEWLNGRYGSQSAIAFAFAHKLYEELGVPIGILNGSFSETSIQAWTSRVGFRDGKDAFTQEIYQRILETDPATPEHKAAWERFYQEIEDGIAENAARVARGEPAVAVSANRPGNLDGNRDASWLFNGRISPLAPYAIRGAIWNQGYANMREGLYYYNSLHNLIRGWRLVWDRPDLPVYFHQFYTAGSGSSRHPSVGSVSEMRHGTLMARDIPHTGMASQIDVAGAIHYNQKAVPGQRLALHALKNQYPSTTLKAGGKAKDLVADGPIFKSYKVKGNQLIVSFDHADGGLLVAETKSGGLLKPEVIENGEDQVSLFYLADADRVWHPASFKIDGDKVILTADGVDEPRGVSYASGGIGWKPNLYNAALLPMSPFITYDHEWVLSANWPDAPLKIAGVVVDAEQPEDEDSENESAETEDEAPIISEQALSWTYRRMPLLSTQFRDKAVLQADVPVTIWGGIGIGSGNSKDPKYEGEIVFRFGPSDESAPAIVEKTIPVTADMKDWQVTLPPQPAGDKAYTLYVAFKVDGMVAHMRNVTNIVFGDVFYVAVSGGDLTVPATDLTEEMVRVMPRSSMRDRFRHGSRFTISGSTTIHSRNSAKWWDQEKRKFPGARALGHWIAARTGNPVGIIYMQTKGDAEIKEWMPAEDLKLAPSLLADYKDLSALRPGNEYYDANLRAHIADWKRYWSDEVPRMIATRAVQGGGWGSYPSAGGSVTSNAGGVFNVMTLSFTPASLKGIIFVASPGMVEKAGAAFDEQMAALTSSWKTRFGGEPFMIVVDANETGTRLLEQIEKKIK